MDVLGRDNEVTDPFIEELIKEEDSGMQRTRSWVSMWQESLRYFLSDQLRGRIRHKDWQWVVLNYIWPAIFQEIAKLSRNNQTIIAHPWESSDADDSETWQSMLQWQWEKGLCERGMRIEQLYAMLCGKLFGYRISKIYWEPRFQWDDTNKTWTGDVRHRLWHPAEFWSSETEFINEGNCGTARYVNLEWAQARWPDHSKDLEDNSVSYRETAGGDNDVVRGQTAAVGTYPAAGTGGRDSGESPAMSELLLSLVHDADRMSGMQAAREQDRRFVKLSEHYRKNTETTHEKEEQPIPAEELLASGRATQENGYVIDEDGTPLEEHNWPTQLIREWDQPKFPYGRYIIRNEQTILNPGEDDQKYPCKSGWPFVVVPHYLLPFMWQGSDAVQLYKSTQDMINVTTSHLANNMMQFGDPRIAIEDGALATPPGKHKKRYKIFKGAGAIIRLRRGGIKRYKIEPPVPPSVAAIHLYGLFSQEFKNIVGLQDIAQGKKSTGQMSATEAQHLAISSNDRIYLQSLFENDWIKRNAMLISEFDQKYYDPGRWVRIVGQDRTQSVIKITQQLTNIKLDIDIEPGMKLPYDEEKNIVKHEKAYAILQNPIANPMTPEMLRILEIPNWQKLLAKYEAWQLYYSFYQLYEGVKTGKVDPRQAIRMIVQKATQLYMQEQANTVQEQEKGQSNE